MACFDSHQGGPIGQYTGRFGAYEVSVRQLPATFQTEIAMCYKGTCIANLFDEENLYQIQRTTGGSMRNHAFDLLARQLERKLENQRHDSMMTTSGYGEGEMYAQAHHSEISPRDMAQREAMERSEAKIGLYLHNSTPTTPPPISVNINARSSDGRIQSATTTKKKGKMSGTLREQLQEETNEWLKEVKNLREAS